MKGTRPEGRKVEASLAGATGQELVAAWLGAIRAVMYAETLPEGVHYSKSAVWFQDVQLLKQAVTWPAKECEERGWPVPVAVFDRLVRKTLGKIALRARIPFTEMRRRGAYFFHALQDEFRHNWDEYWDASKSAVNAGEIAAAELARRGPAAGPAPGADAQAVLAQAHRLLLSGGGRKKGAPGAGKKLARGEGQAELF